MILKFNEYIEEKKITIDLEEGDEILTGRFKNKKRIVKKFGKDKNNQPTVNDKPMLNFRIKKLMTENNDLDEYYKNKTRDNKILRIIENILLDLYKQSTNKCFYQDFIKHKENNKYYIISLNTLLKYFVFYLNSSYITIDNNISYNIQNTTNINYNVNNFQNILRDKILICYFLNIYPTCKAFEELNININNTIEEAIDIIIKSNNKMYIDYLVDLLKNNYLPSFIIDKYDFLIKSKNFDLI